MLECQLELGGPLPERGHEAALGLQEVGGDSPDELQGGPGLLPEQRCELLPPNHAEPQRRVSHGLSGPEVLGEEQGKLAQGRSGSQAEGVLPVLEPDVNPALLDEKHRVAGLAGAEQDLAAGGVTDRSVLSEGRRHGGWHDGRYAFFRGRGHVASMVILAGEVRVYKLPRGRGGRE